MGRTGPTAHGLPQTFAFNPRAISFAEGIRAALSVAVIVAANEWLNWPPLSEAALAAWLACLCDPGGPVRRRVPHLLAFGLIGAGITGLYGLLAIVAPLPVVVLLGAAGVFCTAFARIYGQGGMQVGNLLSVTLVLVLARPAPDARSVLELTALFLGGSFWALLLTMVVWRVYPHAPARAAVADAWAALATLVGDLRDINRHPAPHDTIWDRHARAQRRAVREAIEAAREEVLATVRSRGPVTGRAAQSWIRLETAEQIFGGLIALSELLREGVDPATRQAADRILRLLRPVLLVLGRFMVTDAPDRLHRLDRAVAEVERTAAALPDSQLHRAADLIVERLRIAINLSAPEGVIPGTPPNAPPPPWRERVLGPIRANLNWSSAALLHALRAAAAAAVAFVVTLGWPTSYGYWGTITLVLTMQPYFALTFSRAVERIGGTVLGGGIAALVAMVVTTPLTMAAALFPLTILALTVRRVNFGLFICGLTPIVVLLVGLGRPGESELHVAVMRALYTAGGGALALAFSALLWPSWEPDRLRAEVRRAMRAHGAYAAAEIGFILHDVPRPALDSARRAAGVASNNLEASLQRALLEPVNATSMGQDRLEAALTIDAALRRIAGRLSTLQLDAPDHDHERAAWRGWAAWIEDAANRLCAARADLPPRPRPPPGDPDAEGLVRVARQMELIAGVIARVA